MNYSVLVKETKIICPCSACCSGAGPRVGAEQPVPSSNLLLNSPCMETLFQFLVKLNSEQVGNLSFAPPLLKMYRFKSASVQTLQVITVYSLHFTC